MSLSILIPIYNFDVSNLVNDLYKQCKKLEIDFEIVLVDDFSEIKYHDINKKLNNFSNISYERLAKNIGRSKIRNYLFKKAVFENCLILDCDVAVISLHFIKNYIDAIQDNCVVVGGHVYQSEPPKDTSKILHWKYGTQVECKSLKKRKNKPYDSFMTNSFLIQKKAFDVVKFDESISKYGHEDTLFGIALEEKKIKIKHIDNPVCHQGLKNNQEFLKREKEAICNLIVLSEKYGLEKFIKKSKLLRYEKSNLLNIRYFFTPIFNNNIESSLFNGDLSLEKLNYWKYMTLKEMRKKH